MRNKFLMILFVFVGSVFYTKTTAQSLSVEAIENSIKKDGKYALLVSNARYFQAAVMTGKGFKANNPKMDFEIVLIGPVVKDLAKDESLKSFIETSEKVGIRLVVCEAAMNHFELKNGDFHNSIQFSPDGFVYMFGLQESGFKTITL
ncbi:DsrE family protein [Bizionia myxarmorum]|uniref:DsrE family protein n=1 Tax=Bizionia myxarmorum TaxID=291186 RepID=A0A5D0RBV1_9FLAO|nr:DsrE family protein [Bizionia myxarmorum]TYB78853.1 DsrE family protein [Bizionia myxarmorum]